MTRTRRWSLPAVLASLAIAVSACGTSTASPSTAPSSAAPAPSTSAASSAGPFTASTYPESGEAPCGETAAPDATHDKYGGNFKKLSATDEKTVVFDLCNPDVAFLAKIAFSSFAINDAGWLASHIDPAATEGQKIVSEVNGTGAYKLKAWNRGQDVSYEAYDGYWGTKALTPSAILRWNKEAAQRLVELQAGTVDGIDNVGPTDFATVEGDSSLALKPRTGQTETQTFKVRIPAGVQEGQTIRVPGKGDQGGSGASSGDLYLRVRLAAHPDFRVRGADLYYDLDLAPWEAVLGTTASVPTLGGRVEVRIPPGTNNGRQLRVRGRGLPKGKGAEPGDLYVVVNVQLPQQLNEEERALWEKLSRASRFNPRER